MSYPIGWRLVAIYVGVLVLFLHSDAHAELVALWSRHEIATTASVVMVGQVLNIIDLGSTPKSQQYSYLPERRYRAVIGVLRCYASSPEAKATVGRIVLLDYSAFDRKIFDKSGERVIVNSPLYLHLKVGEAFAFPLGHKPQDASRGWPLIDTHGVGLLYSCAVLPPPHAMWSLSGDFLLEETKNKEQQKPNTQPDTAGSTHQKLHSQRPSNALQPTPPSPCPDAWQDTVQAASRVSSSR